MTNELDQYTYQGNDLGVSYSKQSTTLKVWAPTAAKVHVNLYKDGTDGLCMQSIPMKKEADGIWSLQLIGDQDRVYYTYLVNVNGLVNEAVDPYAKAVGVNGERGMILDLARTNPDGFLSEKKPEFLHSTDAVIYELHIRDFSSNKDSGSKFPGKYLAFTEKETKNHEGMPTLMAYLKSLGITHVHLLPAFDYGALDEGKDVKNQYNWGYDPLNYNVPEGSYSTNPYDGAVRIKEFKQMVQALHSNGIRVIMDMVYNHTYLTEDSNFNKIVPDYYYRKDGEKFSDASACGNETASDHAMMRKFIVESVVYWAKEYHIDGFRFDLMGIHDIVTMNELRKALDDIDPSILMYGEGWTGGKSTLTAELRAMKCNMSEMSGIGAFCDDIRDAVKGSVFEEEAKGFANGGCEDCPSEIGNSETAAGKALVSDEVNQSDEILESIKFGIVAATKHPQIDYLKVNYSKQPWAMAPGQCINYVSAHDNLTLWDKLCLTNPDDSNDDRVAMNKLAAAIILTSQGIPFFQAGEEMLRTKPFISASNQMEKGMLNATENSEEKSVLNGTENSEEKGVLSGTENSEDMVTKENLRKFDDNSYRSPDATNSIKWENEANVCEVIEYYKGLIEFRKAHPCLHFNTTKEIQKNLRFLENVGENVIAYTVREEVLECEGENPRESCVKDECKRVVCVIFNANPSPIKVTLPLDQWKIYVDEKHSGTKMLRYLEGNEVEVAHRAAIVMVHEMSF